MLESLMALGPAAPLLQIIQLHHAVFSRAKFIQVSLDLGKANDLRVEVVDAHAIVVRTAKLDTGAVVGGDLGGEQQVGL